jgi:hypothetical protein
MLFIKEEKKIEIKPSKLSNKRKHLSMDNINFSK